MPLTRLEALTYLVEFADQQRKKGSPYTSGWADYHTVKRWEKTIAHLREIIPNDDLREFDDYRRRKKEMFAKMD